MTAGPRGAPGVARQLGGDCQNGGREPERRLQEELLLEARLDRRAVRELARESVLGQRVRQPPGEGTSVLPLGEPGRPFDGQPGQVGLRMGHDLVPAVALDEVLQRPVRRFRGLPYGAQRRLRPGHVVGHALQLRLDTADVRPQGTQPAGQPGAVVFLLRLQLRDIAPDAGERVE
ncbi:hypothetical protein PV409_35175 [Streptomyces sp. ME02-6979.5a]|uniref:hypothetical protein n=1 Tax=Streptomyces sp. ME02-6979.5a TaxID=462925 RepID=UPI0029A093E3|nr:hypothetical protein [Streptomyces sp. ME02-6979.5a]MDX3343202.1 hypothetical protein [Streptomyces sp. ME02-6979.5a]